LLEFCALFSKYGKTTRDIQPSYVGGERFGSELKLVIWIIDETAADKWVKNA
jgi:hypothetical protein